MSISAMKQALEALEWPLERLVNLCNNSASCSNTEEVIEAEAALERLYKARQAIEQAEKQEPVYAYRRKGLDDFCTCNKNRYLELSQIPNLFEVKIFYAAPVHAIDIPAERVDETAKSEHDMKDMRCECCGYLTHQREHMGCIRAAYEQKREWVGLTDEDIAHLRRAGAHSVSDKDFRAIEAKLKEKNT